MKSGITLLVTCLLVIGLPALATDADGDGYHVGTTGTPGGDCNDNDATTYPGATEINDGKDNDCDFLIDENNTPPIANPDFVSVSDLISPITINVLANDGDPTPTTAPLIVSIVGPTPHGTLTIINEGTSILFTPNGSFTGSTQFYYYCRDRAGQGGLDSVNAAKVYVGANLAPTPADDILNATSLSSSIVIDALSNDSDPNPLQTLTIISAGTTPHGTVSVTGGGTTLTFTPNNTFRGSTQFTYTVRDNFPSLGPTITPLSATATVSISTGAGTVPGRLNYQGRIAVNGVNFSGTGQFKFALVNSQGNETYWSNDSTSTGGGQPASAVSIPVSNGLYSVQLGDNTLPNMLSNIPAIIFTNNDVRLRIWFNDGINGFQLLTPDQRIASSGYSLVAEKLATPLTGDVFGSHDTNRVVGLQGHAVAAIMPANGQSLRFDGTQWAPSLLDLANGTTGTLPESRLSANIPRLNAANSFSNPGNIFVGNGSGLTGIQASAVTGTFGSTQIAAGAIGSAQLASGLTLAGTTSGSFNGNLIGNVSGSATSFTGTLSGDVTGTQGATTISATTVTGKVLSGFASTTGTITSSDTILTAICKLHGNDALKAPLASPTFTGTASGSFSGSFSGNGSALSALNGANISSGTVGSAQITDGSIANADISPTAAVAYSKLNLSASIINADIATSAAITDTKLATISTPGKVSNSATTGTATNIGNALVLRDASGGFSAGTISGSFSGSGASLTSLNASSLASGTVPDARLSSNVALRGAANSFSGTQSFNVDATKSLQIRYDNSLVPAINIDGTGGNLGVMRLRNAMEIWPSDDATRAGKLDVRDSSGSATITLSGSSGNVTASGALSVGDNVTAGHFYTVTQSTMAPVTGSTLSPTTGYVKLTPASAITLSSTSAISAGSVAGQILLLEGTSDTGTVTVPDSGNMRLTAARVLGNGDTLTLLWNGSAWVETAYSNN